MKHSVVSFCGGQETFSAWLPGPLASQPALEKLFV